MQFDSFGSRVNAVFTSWEETKLFLEHSMRVSTESLHIFGGVLIFFVAAAVIRRPVSTRWPWLVVLGFALLNEVADLSFRWWPSPGAQFGESAKDIVLTMLIPSVLLFTVRKTPRLFHADPRSSAPVDENSAV